MPVYDVAVIGVGGIGSAVLAEAAKRCRLVIGVDRWTPPHDRGSSHGQSRIIRKAYFEHPDYVPLLEASYQGWRELQRVAERQLLFQVGLLQCGPSSGEVVPAVRRAADQHRLPLETLSPAEVARRWTGMSVPLELDCVYEQEAGYLLAEQSVASWLQLAERRGAELLCDSITTRFDNDGNTIVVEAGNHTIECHHLIVTAGPWAGQLLAQFDASLRVIRKAVFWHAAPPATAQWPTYLFELPDGVYYGFPNIGGRGAKIGEHSGGQPCDDPANVSRSIDAADAARVTSFRQQCLPALGGMNYHATCLYTMSPDGHLIVDTLPDDRRIALAAGLSGHGFKFAPALGRALVDLVLDGGTDLPIGFLGLSRFAQ